VVKGSWVWRYRAEYEGTGKNKMKMEGNVIAHFNAVHYI